VGGIALHADGGLVISGKNICHVKDGATRILFTRDDAPGFNDLFTDAQGRVYTGTMKSDPFRIEGERVAGECWRIEGEGKGTELYGGVLLTNGIGFSPDGTRIYHCDTARACVLVHALDASGRATPLRPIPVEGGPDGLAVDAEGGVWVALYQAGGVQRLLPDGRPERRIDVPARMVTSLCFGGGTSATSTSSRRTTRADANTAARSSARGASRGPADSFAHLSEARAVVRKRLRRGSR
jgi:gluconolactonase